MEPLSALDRARREIEQRLTAAGLKYASYDVVKVRQKFSLSAHAAWEIPLDADYLGITRTLILALPTAFDDDPPTAFVTPTAYQQWPHVETSGRLCLWRSDHPPDNGNVGQLTGEFFELVGRILALKDAAKQKERESEFVDEWLSYWAPKNGSESKVYLAAPVPKGHTKLFSRTLVRVGTPNLKERRQEPLEAWHPVTLLSHDPKLLEQWGADFLDTDRPPIVQQGLFIRLERISSPAMPTTLSALYDWLAACGCDAVVPHISGALAQLEGPSRRLLLVFAFETPRGTALVGTHLKAIVRSPKPPSGYQNHKTRSEARRCALGAPAWTLSSLQVKRADRDWMRDRAHDPASQTLSARHVVIVGCGMLGSPIAEHLARAGVGKITLIDPDHLDPANIGRHVLGASYIGQFKAKALAHHLKASLPALEAVPINEDVTKQHRQDLWEAGVNLVICTTADWRSERFLMRRRTACPGAPPLLMAWLEPYAATGHAILSTRHDDDLLRFFTGEGRPRLACTAWPAGIPFTREPACQAAFNPAGAAAAAPSIALIANVALGELMGRARPSYHSYYFCGASQLEALGGVPTPFARLGPERAFVERELTDPQLGG